MKDIKAEAGKRIRYFRQEKGWTIEELSFRAGVHPNYLGDAERGKRNLSLESLSKIAKGLGLPVSSLVASPASKQVPLRTATYKLVRKLTALLKDAPPREQEFVVTTVKFLTKRMSRR